jgi:membrane protease YdiL (CAAX protease family)
VAHARRDGAPLAADRAPAAPAAPTDAARFLGLVDALWLFLVARPVRGVGHTFALRGRDVGLAAGAFVAFALVAVPVGVATGFIAWNPRLGAARVLGLPLLAYLTVALPEEFLFRGLIQNVLGRLARPAVALGAASVVFGLAHLPDPRYVLLATVAGVAYGWVYARTGKITAAAITHALVDAVWVVLFRR